jgi:hypothetical protein
MMATIASRFDAAAATSISVATMGISKLSVATTTHWPPICENGLAESVRRAAAGSSPSRGTLAANRFSARKAL